MLETIRPTGFGRKVTIAAVFVLMLPFSAKAVDWGDQSYSLISMGMDVRVALREIGTNAGINVNLDNGISGTLNTSFQDQKLKTIFRQIVEDHQLAWFFDGRVLHIVSEQNMGSRLVRLESLSPTLLERRFSKMGVLSRDNPSIDWELLEDKKMIRIMGPEQFLEKTEELALSLDDRSTRVSTVYRWKDGNGRVHYSNKHNTAVPEDVSILEYRIQPGNKDTSARGRETTAESNLRSSVAIREDAELRGEARE